MKLCAVEYFLFLNIRFVNLNPGNFKLSEYQISLKKSLPNSVKLFACVAKLTKQILIISMLFFGNFNLSITSAKKIN